MKKSFIVLMLICALVLVPAAFAQAAEGDAIIILHTNDSHANIENGLGFAGVAAYDDMMEAEHGAEMVTLVDAGDAVQGGPIGKLTNGEAIIELMNLAEYDIFVPGNHEFDYQVPQFMNLMTDLEATVVAANFIDLTTDEPVFDAYTMVNYGDIDIAYLGITTPETYTKSTPTYFQNEAGEFIYSFSEDADGEGFYDVVQMAIDEAIAAGAEYVVAIGHLGVEEGSAPYRSTDVIANTSGIDIFIDGHSHTEMIGEIYQDENGEDVILSQTGDKFNNLGKITIDPVAETITSELISGEEYTEKDATVQAAIDELNGEFELLLQEVVAQSDVPLVVNDPTTEERLIRHQETNLGNLVADAYLTMLEADIAIVNGGGIRADIAAGDITYGQIIEVHPFGNNAMSVMASGQNVLDALEMGAMNAPGESGGFLHVAGITYTINTAIPSSVVVDEQGAFVSVDGAYRVEDVMVGDAALDLEAMYVVASHDYLLLAAGDGMSMFADAEPVKLMYMIDNEVLINYIVENLGGVVGEEYADINGSGRITVLASGESVVAPEPTPEPTSEPEPTPTPEPTPAPTPAPVVPDTTPVAGTYTVVSGDTLWEIAKSELSNGGRYKEIYELNKGIIDHIDLIFPGQVLTMPAK